MVIDPAFDFGDFPEPVVLASGHAVLTLGQDRFEGDAQIRAVALPREGIEILGRFKGLSDAQRFLMFSGHGNWVRTLSFNGQDIPGFQLSVESIDDEIQLRWCPGTLPLRLANSGSIQLGRVVFHIFNFFNLHRLENGRLVLENDEWTVTLSQVDNIEEVERKCHADGMCGLTHVGEIVRKDGSSFEISDVEERLRILQYFMAFVRGTWCDPICAVGFDSDNARTWELFSAPQRSSYAISSWFDYVHPEQMVKLFPLFSQKWQSSDQWRSCLREVIYWYVNANTAGGVPGIDVSILLSQAALERLSHQFSVVDRRIISAESFKSSQLKASDKLRLLLSSLQVPIDIPTQATDMKKFAQRLKWVDGPHAHRITHKLK